MTLKSLFAYLLLFAATNSHAALPQESDPESQCDSSLMGEQEMMGCEAVAHEKLDAKLNAVYNAVIHKLEKDDARRLAQIQRAWLNYMHADCKFRDDLDEATFKSGLGGQDINQTTYHIQAGTAHQACENAHMKVRIVILEAIQSDTSGP